MKKVTYKNAGVNTHMGREFTSLIKKLQRENTQKGTEMEGNPFAKKLHVSPIDFVSLMDVTFLKEYKNPLLVTGVDGVGTKVELARLFDYHKTVGIDLVAMCVNDILCSGAKSMQFLDYIACGKLSLPKMKVIVESILTGCKQANCVLVGGETAEHPGTMPDEQYDLAGFAIGVVDREELVDGTTLQIGDIAIGLPSSGVHANGLSLIRKLYLKKGMGLPESKDDCDFLFTNILSKATVIYEPVLRPLLNQKGNVVRAIAHVTGGGFFENIPRVLGKNIGVSIQLSSWETPDLFLQIAQRANLSQKEMLHTFNMGIGMIVFLSKESATDSLDSLKKSFQKNYPDIQNQPVIIGEIEPRKDGDAILTID